jgi:hypothetical protein
MNRLLWEQKSGIAVNDLGLGKWISSRRSELL